MPVVHFSVPEGLLTAEKGAALTRGACELFAAELAAPVDRVRAYLNSLPPWAACAGSIEGGAPFYHFYVLQDRSPEQVARLHQGFANLLVEVLGVDLGIVRGVCQRVPPADWGISGKPASEVRKAELDQRKSEREGS